MSFQWNNPYPTIRLPVFARNVVATSHPLAVQAGLRILQAGGNAVDAAVAAAAALTIVEPVSCGIGSDAFALVWDDGQLHGLNASGTAPAAWTPGYFRERYGETDGIARQPVRGWDTVTVPGAVAAWAALNRRFGRLPLAAVLEPAAEIAERGHAVAPVVAMKWAAGAAVLRDQPGFAEAFLPTGRPPAVGELFVLPAAARTLRLIGESNGEAFYRGELAERIASCAGQAGAALTADDLAGYQPDWVEPISLDYRGYRVHQIPPNGQGIATLIALGILNSFDLAALPVDSVRSQHLQIEAIKLAFSDLYHHVADPRAMTVSVKDLLDPNYLAARARLITADRAGKFVPGSPPRGGTVYLTTADDEGRMVSFIQSNYMGFGSGVVVPGTGISLQNRGRCFSCDPASPNVVAPGKRPFHTIIPGFVSRDGAPVMSFGVMGAEMQPQGQVQTLTRMIDYHQQPQAACDAPRWKVNSDFSLDLESTFAADVGAGLRDLGHATHPHKNPYLDFGSGQFIWRLGHPDGSFGYVAASDARRDGCAGGF